MVNKHWIVFFRAKPGKQVLRVYLPCNNLSFLKENIHYLLVIFLFLYFTKPLNPMDVKIYRIDMLVYNYVKSFFQSHKHWAAEQN